MNYPMLYFLCSGLIGYYIMKKGWLSQNYFPPPSHAMAFGYSITAFFWLPVVIVVALCLLSTMSITAIWRHKHSMPKRILAILWGHQ